MALDRNRINEMAELLMRAEAELSPIPPLTDMVAEMTADDAYQVQLTVLKRQLDAGRKVVAKKVGLTSKVMQEMAGVDQPDYGMILDHMLVEHGAEFQISALLQPKIEPEIAFMLNKDLRGPGVTVEQVLASTEYVFPALEIIDSRIKDWKIKLADTIADNASSARVVVGSPRIKVDGLDLVNEDLVFMKNGEEIGRGKGEAVLGHPANAVAWAANKLSEYGIVLEAGEFVMPGSLCRASDVAPGDTISAVFSNVGTVEVRFV